MIKPKNIFWMIIFWLSMAGPALAKPLFLFEGYWDVQAQEVKMDLRFSQGGTVTFHVRQELSNTLRLYTEVDRLKTVPFKISTRIEGDLLLVNDPQDPDLFLTGTLFSSDTARVSRNNLSEPPLGSFDIRKDRFYLKSLTWGGLRGQGYFGLMPPYDVDLQFDLNNVSLVDFLSWFTDSDMLAQGEVSGRIRVTGSQDQASLTGALSSYDGEIGNFFYDYIIAEFDGFYPMIRLRQTNVAQKDGVNVRVSGTLDFSQDFANFNQQIAGLKIDPLIVQRDIEQQWTIRRERSQRQQAETKFHYRLRKTRETSGVDESDMLGIQRSIRF